MKKKKGYGSRRRTYSSRIKEEKKCATSVVVKIILL
jgi:hypothetical protein